MRNQYDVSTSGKLSSILLRHQSSTSSLSLQEQRLRERKNASSICNIRVAECDFVLFPGVYRTGIDTQLIITHVDIEKTQTFIEIGCGAGVASIFLSRCAYWGVAVDINDAAVRNTTVNAQAYQVHNLTVVKSDIFSNVTDVFDVVIFNPPYSDRPINNNIDRMFWDPCNQTKKRFFLEVKNHLSPTGRVFFGWANFSDLDATLPARLAEAGGLLPRRLWTHRSDTKPFIFYLIEFVPQN